MLQAIIHGKAAKVSDEKGVSHKWSSVFKTREDLLTAAFFGRLPYLSDNSIHFLIQRMLSRGAIVGGLSLGKFKKVEFWPRLKSKDPNRKSVEPDLLIYFEDLIVLVEVKPPHMPQSYDQWHRELGALSLKTKKTVHFLALGGRFENWQKYAKKLQNSFHVSVSVCRWREVVNYLSELDKFVSPDSSNLHSATDHRVIVDQLKALELHGIHKPAKPFADLNGMMLVTDENLLAAWKAPDLSAHKLSLIDWSDLIQMPEIDKEVLKLWR